MNQIEHKKPEQIIREQWTDYNIDKKPFIQFMSELMKIYGNAKLDEAKEVISLLETKVYTNPDQEIDYAMKSILELKDEI